MDNCLGGRLATEHLLEQGYSRIGIITGPIDWYRDRSPWGPPIACPSVTVDAVVYYEATDPVKLLYNVADFYTAATKLAQTNLRNIIGDMQLDESLTSREKINVALRQILDNLVANGDFNTHVAYFDLRRGHAGDTMLWDSEDSAGNPWDGSFGFYLGMADDMTTAYLSSYAINEWAESDMFGNPPLKYWVQIFAVNLSEG